MTPTTSRRLLEELTNAEIAYRLRGIPVHEFCRRRSHKYLGETKRELLRVAALGDGANDFMTIFLESFDERED